MSEHFVERPELFEQRAGFLGADQRHAGNVVDAVTDQGLEVDDLVGTHPPRLGQEGFVLQRVLADVVELHAGADQLSSVLVAGDDPDLVSCLHGPPGQGGEDVIGLPAFEFQYRQSEAGHHFLDQADLRNQVGRHLVPVRLVFGIPVVADALAGRVHGTEKV